MIARVLDIAILGLFMERDHHGYEIRTQLRDHLGLWSSVSFGSIYPALARLERHGLVEVVGSTPKMGPLSTGSLSGERASLRTLRATPGLGRRGRKVYRITEAGRAEFMSMLADPSTMDDARSFSLRMALAKYLGSAARKSLLARRRADLERQLDEVSRRAANRDLDDNVRGVLDHAVHQIQLDLEWVTRLETPQPSNLAHEAN